MAKLEGYAQLEFVEKYEEEEHEDVIADNTDLNETLIETGSAILNIPGTMMKG